MTEPGVEAGSDRWATGLPGARGALPQLVHRWRHSRSGDPGLAVVMSPSAWPAPLAGQVFWARRAEWSPSAWTTGGAPLKREWTDATHRSATEGERDLQRRRRS